MVVHSAFAEVGPSPAYEEKHISSELFLLEPNMCVRLHLPSNEITRKLPPRIFKYGARIACSLSAAQTNDPLSREVVLLDIHGEEKMPDNDHFHLSRNVVSVELQGTLRVAIQAYTPSCAIAQQSHVDFPAKYCQTSIGECLFGNSKVKIIIAWSLLVKERLDLMLDGYLALP